MNAAHSNQSRWEFRPILDFHLLDIPYRAPTVNRGRGEEICFRGWSFRKFSHRQLTSDGAGNRGLNRNGARAAQNGNMLTTRRWLTTQEGERGNFEVTSVPVISVNGDDYQDGGYSSDCTNSFACRDRPYRKEAEQSLKFNLIAAESFMGTQP